jgi:hypothetical protein
MLARFSKIGAGAAALLWTSTAIGQLRLRGDALADTQAPVGLVILHGDSREGRIDAETVAWMGGQSTGDVLTLTVRARHPESGSEIRVGRMVTMMGALRPVHMDGARALGRLGNTTVEAFGGVPVVPAYGFQSFDWTAGGRVAETAGIATVGAAYAIRTHDEETGVDFALAPTKWLTAAARSSYDLTSRGIADALVSLSTQNADVRGELFAAHRDPARLIPKTSLFSVLGDIPATTTGATARWLAAPRLELIATSSVQTRGPKDVGAQSLARANLALDDGAVGLELRRVDFETHWLGARTTLSMPFRSLRVGTELELVRPTKNVLWPWALVALSWWNVSGAVEASSGPDRAWIAAIVRYSYAFEAR